MTSYLPNNKGSEQDREGKGNNLNYYRHYYFYYCHNY